MSEEADVNAGFMVAEDELMNREKRKSEKGNFLESQMTVTMTGNKVSEVVTPSKEKEQKEIKHE